MRKGLLSLFVLLLLLVGCDPKVDQRAERYSPDKCPTCVNGTCVICHGTEKCQYCHGTGTRVSSTKNYTGEGVNLVDLTEPCPFCHGTGKCPSCEGTAKCYTCNGTDTVHNWNNGEIKYRESRGK